MIRSGVVLRPYSPADAGLMTGLDALCFDPTFLFSERTMRRMAECATAITVVAESADGGLAGFVIAHTAKRLRVAYLVTLDVHPAFRRDRLGTRLLQAVETQLLEKDVSRLELHVHTRNGGAIRFYEALGFVRERCIAEFYGSGLDAFLYASDLPLR